MRAMVTFGVVAALACGLPGCNNNQAKAEQLMQQIVDEMNKISDSIEKGDKAGLDASLARIRQIAQSGKDLKITKAQEKSMEDKFKPQMEQVQKKLEAATKAAIMSGKMSPEDLTKFGQEMMKFGEEMKAMGGK